MPAPKYAEPWLQVRAVYLMDADAHGLVNAHIGAPDQGALTLEAGLQGGDDPLVVVDRACLYLALLAYARQGQFAPRSRTDTPGPRSDHQHTRPGARGELSYPRDVKNRAHRFPSKKCQSGIN
jgi:hypothetical protein